MIRLKAIELVEARNAFEPYLSRQLPYGLSKRMGNIVAELDKHILRLKSHRLAMADKYKELDDPEGFNKKSIELMMSDVKLDVDKIPEELIDKVEVRPSDMKYLSLFVE